MRAVDTVRKEEARRLADEDIGVLKKTRYMWLKNSENLTEGQRVRLSELERLNLKVNREICRRKRNMMDETRP